MTSHAIAQRTYLYDLLRAIPHGVIEASSTTFLMLVAVKVFNADPLAKSLIAASGNAGLLVSLWTVPIAERLRRPATRVAAAVMLVGAAAMLLAALLPWLPVLVAASVVSIGGTMSIVPLITATYQTNYEPRSRGRLVSRAFVVRVAAAAICAELFGRLLTANLGFFRWTLGVLALAFAASALCLWRIPSQLLPHNSTSQGWFTSALSALRFVSEDRTLRWTLTSWMLMGFANLMMLPLRVEFLANPRYGIMLSPQQVALYTVLIPNGVRLVLSPLWGRLFDRMNFFAMRITLNAGFALGIASFFTGTSTVGLVIGSMLLGAAAAGGELAWSLWVTKIAPADRVAEYMSIHTFLTGVRGVVAPAVAFQLTQVLPISGLGLFAAGLIVLASLLLVPEMRTRSSATPA